MNVESRVILKPSTHFYSGYLQAFSLANSEDNSSGPALFTKIKTNIYDKCTIIKKFLPVTP